MKILVNIFLISVLLIGGCRSTQESSSRAGYDFSELDKIAIVAVEGTIKSEVAKDEIADFFAMELLKKGYAPMGRPQVRALLQEKEAALEELSITEGAVEAGKILEVPVVLAIHIPHFGEEISISAKMIDVEDGSILWLSGGSGRGGSAFSRVFGRTSDSGIGDSGEDELLGPIMGEVVDVTRQPLTPQEAKKAQSIVKRMCQSVPSKITLEW